MDVARYCASLRYCAADVLSAVGCGLFGRGGWGGGRGLRYCAAGVLSAVGCGLFGRGGWMGGRGLRYCATGVLSVVGCGLFGLWKRGGERGLRYCLFGRGGWGGGRGLRYCAAGVLSAVGCGLPEVAAAGIESASGLASGEQLLRFLRMEDPIVRQVALGTILMGVVCGWVGCLVLLRGLSLAGESLAHASLPGVVGAFALGGTAKALWVPLGAAFSASLGALWMAWAKGRFKLKYDALQGMVLSGFFAVGTFCLIILQQKEQYALAEFSGIFFGQIVAISTSQVWQLGILCLLTLLLLVFFYRFWLCGIFDSLFAQSIRYCLKLRDIGLWTLLLSVVVISAQVAGLVLVSALLITPAASAYLLTRSLPSMLLVAGGLGGACGGLGGLLSFLNHRLPTGALIVLCGFSCFLMAILFSPRHGWIPRYWNMKKQRHTEGLENTLKLLLKEQPAQATHMAKKLNTPKRKMKSWIKRGLLKGWLTQSQKGLRLTASGNHEATNLLRKHHLWELYLTEKVAAHPRWIHEDAEIVEHLIGSNTLEALETELGQPPQPPHNPPTK